MVPRNDWRLRVLAALPTVPAALLQDAQDAVKSSQDLTSEHPRKL